jgi:hypothetical protein
VRNLNVKGFNSSLYTHVHLCNILTYALHPSVGFIFFIHFLLSSARLSFYYVSEQLITTNMSIQFSSNINVKTFKLHSKLTIKTWIKLNGTYLL